MINLNSKTRLMATAHALKSLKNASTDGGFTLLESLMAVAVVSILIVGIAPMVALSTSARVNARRVDQATQAGKSYIEAVRGKVYDTAKFPVSLRSSVNTQGQYVFDVAAPAATFPVPSGCTLNIADPTQNNIDGGRVPGVCVDANGNGFSVDDPQDLVIQPMRSGGTDAEKLADEGFWLAIRVYRADAFATGSPALFKGTEPDCATSKLVFVGTTGSKRCPLVTMRSQIILNLSLNDNKTGTGSN
jgi:prepilin-type N-terminal cleavage/methylation domain-containing protein